MRNIEFTKEIPHRVDSKDFKNLKLMTKKERRQILIQKAISPIFLKIISWITIVYKILNLQSSQDPKSLFQYFSNWVSFFLCLFVRINDWIYYPKDTKFNGLTDSGPLFPKK